jgi:hypothetical protein
MSKVTSVPLFPTTPAPGGATASGTGSEIKTPWGDKFTIFAEGATTAGAGVATLDVQVSNSTTRPAVDADWDTLGTITLTLGTTKTTDSLAVAAPYRWVRVLARGISGTNGWAQAYYGAKGP